MATPEETQAALKQLKIASEAPVGTYMIRAEEARTILDHIRNIHELNKPQVKQPDGDATKPVWPLMLNKYQRDNLITMIQACGYLRKPIFPFQAMNTGDWLGELYWMLCEGPKPTPNKSLEQLEQIVDSVLRGHTGADKVVKSEDVEALERKLALYETLLREAQYGGYMRMTPDPIQHLSFVLRVDAAIDGFRQRCKCMTCADGTGHRCDNLAKTLLDNYCTHCENFCTYAATHQI